MLIGFHHTAISTPDLSRAIGFYCNTLGGEQASEILTWGPGDAASNRMLRLADSSGKFVHTKVGRVYLEIFQFAEPVPEPIDRRTCDFGLARLCFVVDDLQAEHARLTEAGMLFHAEPAIFEDGSQFVYGQDPDGNIIELLEIPESASTPRID